MTMIMTLMMIVDDNYDENDDDYDASDDDDVPHINR